MPKTGASATDSTTLAPIEMSVSASGVVVSREAKYARARICTSA